MVLITLVGVGGLPGVKADRHQASMHMDCTYTHGLSKWSYDERGYGGKKMHISAPIRILKGGKGGQHCLQRLGKVRYGCSARRQHCCEHSHVQ